MAIKVSHAYYKSHKISITRKHAVRNFAGRCHECDDETNVSKDDTKLIFFFVLICFVYLVSLYCIINMIFLKKINFLFCFVCI